MHCVTITYKDGKIARDRYIKCDYQLQQLDSHFQLNVFILNSRGPRDRNINEFNLNAFNSLEGCLLLD